MDSKTFVLLGISTFALACQPEEQLDYGVVCVWAQEVDGQARIRVEADSQDCAADHKGASYECSISLDGATATIETVFQDGKDPNDACAGPLETTCELDVEPGTLTIEFADAQHELLVPGGAPFCLPGGYAPEDTGG